MSMIQKLMAIADDRGEAECELTTADDAGDMKFAAERMGYTVITDGQSFCVLKPKNKPINYPKSGLV